MPLRTRPPLNKGTDRSTPALRLGPLLRMLARLPERVRSRLSPAVADTDGRPAERAIATVASVALSASRWPLSVGLDR